MANAILLSIPDEEFDTIRGSLQYLELPQDTVLHEPRQKLEFAHFLNSGMVSLVFNTNGGESVEVGVVGNEGFTPIPVAAGLRRSPHQAVMQVSGDGFRMSVDALEAALMSSPRLQAMMNRYAAVHGMRGGADRRVQPFARFGAASGAVAAPDSGPGWVRLAANHPRFSGDDAGNGSAEREFGGGLAAEKNGSSSTATAPSKC